ncbi:cholesterol transporter ABCA5-like isoform X2 [Babylonia areolata]|uniref:cholesterol transporter ABCA5-like isoform X2 n=1 Tax=Babylonia areolata TaxID=304850 RepID=UPI003FD2DDC9
MGATFLSQMKAVLWRNVLLKRRNRSQLIQEIFFPLMYIGILVAIKASTKPAIKPPLTFPVWPLENFAISSQTLFVVSNGHNITPVMNKVVAQLSNVDYQEYATQADADQAYQNIKDSGNETNTVGIIFGYPNSSLIQEYAIRMPPEEIANTKEKFTNNQGHCRGQDNADGRGRFDCDANTYFIRGFAHLQSIIDQVLMREFGVTVPDVTVKVQMMPKGEFSPNLTVIQTISSIYFVLAYSFFVNFLTVNLVAEKEKKIREGMFMMGLRNSVFWLSWSLVYFLIILVVTAVVTGVSVAGKFFENSNMFIFFLMLLLYGLSIIALAFLLTPFFKKAKPAGLVASFLTIIMSLAYLAVSQTRTVTDTEYTNSVPPEAQWVMCLLSPVALALAVDMGLYLDVTKGGMTFETIDWGEFPLYAPILMLFLDVVLYFLLAVYLDHVIPGEYGPRYKPLYFLEKSYWFPQKSKSGDRTHLMDVHDSNYSGEAVSGPNIEPMPADMASQRTMRVINISKSFKNQDKEKVKVQPKVFAVKNLSIDMYEGQITCLLGHNGAGKTTLINMLTGVMPPTSGTATIRGLDVSCSGDVEEIRTMCGICPQHNILYDELSAKEHLVIFAGIKGVPADKTEAEVKRAMESVDLLDQADVMSSKLSGGQKRKLSVAMALIGDPKIIFLDEPTAGMDPYSRRHLWSLLKNSKEGRIILLTTHFMDEADILADRKAIISKGQLKCCGSSLYLKNKFGIGYHINMVVEPSCSADKVLDVLKQYVEGVAFDRSHGKELSFTIPLTEVSKFPELFTALETQQGSQTVAQSLGILNYGVSMPTLEEVFLKLGEEEEGNGDSQGSDNPMYNSLSHLDVDFKKMGDNNGQSSQSEIQMRANQHAVQVFNTSHDTKGKTSFCFWMMFKIRFLMFWRSKAAIFFLIFLPIGLVTGALVLNKNSTASPDVTPVPMNLTAAIYANNSGNTDLPNFVVQDNASDTISAAIAASIASLYRTVSYPASTDLMHNVPHYVGTNFLTTDPQNNSLASYLALYNDSALHSLPAVINTLSTSILRQKAPTGSIVTSSLPWPGEAKRSFDGGSFSSSLMIGIAFALIVSSFGSVIVQEKQWKCKSQLRVSGMSFHMYWGVVYVFSLLVSLIPATACLIITLAMQIPSFTPAGAILSLILLFIVFIPQSLLFSLVCSFFFNKFETAQAILPNAFIWIGMIPYITVSMVDMLASQSTAQIIHCIFVFIDPIYMIFGGFYYIDKLDRMASIFGWELTTADYFKFDNNILICIIAGLVDFVLMYFLLRILEVRSDGGTLREALRFKDVNSVGSTPETNADTIDEEDEDVAHERALVDRMEQGTESTQNCVAYVRQIRKEFAKRGKGTKKGEKVKVAVRNLSFSVHTGEVFGLLGPNGAGKTTALSMMTADVHPTKGKVVVGEYQVCSNMSEAFQYLGFCPQHDPLWETITLSEHLELYAALKGVPKNEIPAVVDFFLQNLKLEEHRNKHSKKLSGGTKRKLCYAMAMLGSPRVVLLDEPSTGMDPQSKRFLWDTISSSFEGQERGAILTTHYMEEADALCTRVGIMVNGQLECLGPTQHLKAKYGSGYLLEVKIGGSSSASREELEERVQALEQQLLNLFPTATCLESFAERAQYKIPQDGVPALSLVFAELEKTKDTHNVEEYSFSQSTLEQVFLNFAKKQLEEGEDEDAKSKATPQRQLSRDTNIVVRL